MLAEEKENNAPYFWTCALMIVSLIFFQLGYVYITINEVSDNDLLFSLLLILIPLIFNSLSKSLYEYLLFVYSTKSKKGDNTKINLLSNLLVISLYLYFVAFETAKVSAIDFSLSAFIIVAALYICAFFIITFKDGKNESKENNPTPPSS